MSAYTEGAPARSICQFSRSIYHELAPHIEQGRLPSNPRLLSAGAETVSAPARSSCGRSVLIRSELEHPTQELRAAYGAGVDAQ